MIIGDAFQLIYDFVDRAVRRVDDDGVRGGLEWGDCTFFVATVSFGLMSQDFFQGKVLATASQVVLTAAGSFFWNGGQEEFDLGVREDDGPLIAAFRDDVQAVGSLALQLGEDSTDTRVRCDDAGALCHLNCANGIRDVFIVGEDLAAIKTDDDVDRSISDGGFGREVDLLSQTDERHDPVHGSRVQELKAQPFSQRASSGALSRSSGAVDRDYHRSELRMKN